jgi:hypothetical protein
MGAVRLYALPWLWLHAPWLVAAPMCLLESGWLNGSMGTGVRPTGPPLMGSRLSIALFAGQSIAARAFMQVSGVGRGLWMLCLDFLPCYHHQDVLLPTIYNVTKQQQGLQPFCFF